MVSISAKHFTLLIHHAFKYFLIRFIWYLISATAGCIGARCHSCRVHGCFMWHQEVFVCSKRYPGTLALSDIIAITTRLRYRNTTIISQADLDIDAVSKTHIRPSYHFFSHSSLLKVIRQLKWRIAELIHLLLLNQWHMFWTNDGG